MTETIIGALGVLLAANVIWLTVRIVNRRERWAKRIAVGLIYLAATTGLYALSMGPAWAGPNVALGAVGQ